MAPRGVIALHPNIALPGLNNLRPFFLQVVINDMKQPTMIVMHC